ncbi:hypothetical protein ACWCRF_07285 [Streptomyces sp. NPDC002405]
MRTLLALVLSWLMPSTGKRRATAEQTSTVSTADTPTMTLRATGERFVHPSHRPPLPRRTPRPPKYLRGEDVALIRPYLIAYERAHGINYTEAAA